MNSFWIPQLGSQIYAMAGMSTHLNLEAGRTGDYRGSSANISGKGFSGMTFTARASSENDFQTWLKGVRGSSPPLSLSSYQALALPSEDNPVAYYSQPAPNLFNKIQLQFQLPGSSL
jgi:cytochrome o ubiquinol oxidase subunit 2